MIGVTFDKNDSDAAKVANIVPAVIIDHKQHDDEVNEGKVPDYISEKRMRCTIS